MSRYLRIILSFFFFSVLLTSYAKPAKEDPYFIKTKDSKILSFTPKKIQFFTKAVFFNTYNNKAKLIETDIDVYIDNNYLGKVNNAEGVKIDKKTTFEVPLHISIEPSSILLYNSILKGAKLMAGGQISVKYIGFIRIKVLGFIPVKIRLNDKVEYRMY